jgi:cytochrome P450
VNDHDGYWAVTRYAAVRAIAQDHQTFVSGLGVSLDRPTEAQQPYVMPIEIDPPRQREYRRRVNPHLAPVAVAEFEAAIREIADGLIDQFVERGECDIAVDFARVLPGTVFFRLVAGADDDTLAELEPLARTLSFDLDPTRRAEAAALMRDWASSLLESRSSPSAPTDVVDAVRSLKADAGQFADHELNSGLQILAQGGIGTSAQLIGAVVVLLSAHQDVQTRVRNNPSLIPGLVEESLRLEPPVAMMLRTAVLDTQVSGVTVHAGDRVALLYGAANRDPAVFERPHEFDIDRAINPHVAFGLGVHRCIGSNLARLQVRIAIEQLLARLGPFEIPSGGKVEYVSAGQRGPISIPLVFEASESLGPTEDPRRRV